MTFDQIAGEALLDVTVLLDFTPLDAVQLRANLRGSEFAVVDIGDELSDHHHKEDEVYPERLVSAEKKSERAGHRLRGFRGTASPNGLSIGSI